MGQSVRPLGGIIVGAIGGALFGGIGFAVTTVLFNILVPPKTVVPETGERTQSAARETAVGTGVWQIYGTMEREGGECIRCYKDKDGIRSGILVKKKKVDGDTGGSGGAPSAPEQTVEKSYLSASFALCEGYTLIDRIEEVNGKEGEKVVYERFPSLDADVQEKIDELEEKLLTETNPQKIAKIEKKIAELQSQKLKVHGVEVTPVYGPVSGNLIAELSEKVRLYYGSEEQPVDSVEAEWYDDGVSADRGLTKVVFNKYGALESGTSFRFVLRNAITNRRQIITSRLVRAGVPPTRINLDSIPADAEDYGWYVEGREPARQLAEEVAAFSFHDLHFLATKKGACFTDMTRINPPIVEITEDEMGAYANNDGQGQVPMSSEINLASSEQKPRELKCEFINKDDNFHAQSVVAHWIQAQGEPQTMKLRVVSTIAEISKFNEVALRELQAPEGTTKISILPQYARVCPGVVLSIPEKSAAEPDGRRLVRVVQQTILPEGLLQSDCAHYDPAIYAGQPIIGGGGEGGGPGSGGEDRPAKPPQVPLYATPEIVLIDSVSVTDEMVPQPTVLMVATVPNGLLFGGAIVTPVGAPFKSVYLEDLGTVGVALTAYEYSEADVGVFDYGTTLRVYLDNGSLASASEDDVLAGANLLYWGGTYIGFTTATMIDEQTFDITGLLPGMAGSDYNYSLEVGLPVVKISDHNGVQDPSIVGVPISESYLLRPFEYTVSSAMDATAVSEPVEATVTTMNMKPLAPAPEVTKESDGAGGYILKFTARSRYASNQHRISVGLPPRWSDPLSFTVRLWDGVTIFDIRTVTGDNATLTGEVEVHYTEAELIAAYGSVPPTLEGDVYQRNNGYGDGIVRSFVA